MTDRGSIFNQPTTAYEFDKQRWHLVGISPPDRKSAKMVGKELKFDMCQHGANRKEQRDGVLGFLLGQRKVDPYIRKATCFYTQLWKPFNSVDYYAFIRGDVVNVVVVLAPKKKWSTLKMSKNFLLETTNT